jgi:2-C-methyl-D-erythritol 2,4-cyclodiphosphate synthase
MRIGHGFDVHAFGGEGPIIIGGVRSYEKGLLAHSDGDVALHALTDALLGAAALGDIGKLFPDTDPAFKAPTAANCCAKRGGGFRRKAIPLATLTSPLSPRRQKCCRIFPRCASLLPKISAAIWTM